MKFKIIFFLALFVVAIILFGKFNQETLNSEIYTRSSQIEMEVQSVTSEQKKSIYYMLAYNYANPIKVGEEIFTSKYKSEFYKKKAPLFEINHSIKKLNLDAVKIEEEAGLFIKNNEYLNNNLQAYLDQFLSHCENIKEIPSSYFSSNHIYMYLYKAIKYNSYLIAYDYLKTKNPERTKKLYLTLDTLVKKNDGNLVSTMIHIANFKFLNNFVKSLSIFDISDYQSGLKKNDSLENHQKIVLNDIAETHQLFKKQLSSKNKNDSRLFSNFDFLKKVNFLNTVYTDLMGFVFSPEYLFNKTYTIAKSDVSKCFEKYEDCINKSNNSFSIVTPVKLSYLHMFTFNLLSGLNKLRVQAAAIYK